MMEATKDELNTPLIVVIGILAGIVVFLFVVLMQAYFFRQQNEEETRKVVEVKSDDLTAATAQQKAALHSYRWIDRQKGIVGIPIERAMDLVVQDAAQKPPAQDSRHEP
jgi:hypothetical protein